MGSLIAQPLKNFPNFSASFIQNSNVYFEFDKGTIVIVTQIHSHCFLSAGAMIFVTFIRIVLTAPIPVYSNESVQLFKTINLDLIHTLWGSPDRFQMYGRTKLILITNDAREKKLRSTHSNGMDFQAFCASMVGSIIGGGWCCWFCFQILWTQG